MRTVALYVAAFGCVLSVAPSLRAEIMDTAESQQSGRLSLGGEFQAMQGSRFGGNLHEVVGLLSGVDLVLRQGMVFNQGRAYYLGAAVKWAPLTGSRSQNRPGLAIWLGGHYSGHGGMDATVMVDFPVTAMLRPYLALDTNLEFGDSTYFGVGLMGGLRITVTKSVSWFVEAAYGITHYTHFVSTGPKIYL